MPCPRARRRPAAELRRLRRLGDGRRRRLPRPADRADHRSGAARGGRRGVGRAGPAPRQRLRGHDRPHVRDRRRAADDRLPQPPRTRRVLRDVGDPSSTARASGARGRGSSWGCCSWGPACCSAAGQCGRRTADPPGAGSLRRLACAPGQAQARPRSSLLAAVIRACLGARFAGLRDRHGDLAAELEGRHELETVTAPEAPRVVPARGPIIRKQAHVLIRGGHELGAVIASSDCCGRRRTRPLAHCPARPSVVGKARPS